LLIFLVFSNISWIEIIVIFISVIILIISIEYDNNIVRKIYILIVS